MMGFEATKSTMQPHVFIVQARDFSGVECMGHGMLSVHVRHFSCRIVHSDLGMVLDGLLYCLRWWLRWSNSSFGFMVMWSRKLVACFQQFSDRI